MKVTWIEDDWKCGDYSTHSGSVTVYALRENKRPVGFAREWPESEPKSKKKKRKRKDDAA
jgi:hypothetical protein